MNPSESSENSLLRLADEFAERLRRGERPRVEEYLEKYPELASQIHDVFPAMMVMEKFGSVGGSPTGPYAAAGRSGPMPERLGEYRILREVARGGMGVVYEAVQESLGRHVALKVLPSFLPHSPTHLERFRQEAKAAAKLHHTNIVPVFGVGDHEGVHYYAMQFIQGQGLDAVIDELRRLRQARRQSKAPTDGDGGASIAKGLVSGRFPAQEKAARPAGSASTHANAVASTGIIFEQKDRPDTRYYRSVAQVGVQVAEALAHAHQQRVLHRDIKPSNLLLDTAGTVWITDFGLAKSEGSDDLTSQGEIVGTLRYMAPERFRGQSDGRSDTYSLGLTLYELLTLTPAFDATDKAKLIELVLHEPNPQPRKVDSHIPRDLEIVVLKAMAKAPEDRYATAQELADDLRRFLDDKPIHARRPSLLQRAVKWARRHRGVVTTAVLGIVAALAVIAGSVAWHRVQVANRRDALKQSVKQRVDTASSHSRAAQFAEASAEIRKAEGILASADDVPEELTLSVRQARLELDSAAQSEIHSSLRESSTALKAKKHREAMAAVRHAEDLLAASGLDRKKDAEAVQKARRELEEAATTDIDRALEEAAGFLKDGKHFDALAAVRRAEGVVAAGGEAGKDTTRRVEEARRQVETLKLVEKARLARTVVIGGAFNYHRAEPAYLAAFAHFGLNMAEMKREVIAEKIGSSMIRDQLVAVLDEWAVQVTPDKKRRAEFLAIANLADDDLWRREFRELIVSQDRGELKRLAGLPAVLTQPPPTILLLGLTLIDARAEEEGLRVLRQAQILYPDDLWINHELGLFLGESERKDTEAIGYMNAALALRPGNHGLHNNLGVALLQNGVLEAAEAHFRRALELDREYTDVYRNLATCLFRQRKYEAALEMFDAYLKRRPKHAQTHLNRGQTLVELKRRKEAVAAFEAALRLDPEGTDKMVAAESYRGLGEVFVLENRMPEARVALEKARDFQTSLPVTWETAAVYFYLAQAYEELKETKKAIAAYEKAIELNRNEVPSRVNLGNIYLRTDTAEGYAKAERLYRTALVFRPNNYKVWTNLASVLIRQGRSQEAVDACAETIKRVATVDFVVYYHLGIAQDDLKRPLKAEIAYRKALELAPNDPETLCNLGRLLQRQGRYAQAVGLVRRGHELGSKQPGWVYPSAQWLKDVERLDFLNGKAEAFLRGEPPPKEAFDRFGMGVFLAQYKNLYATAARVYADTLAEVSDRESSSVEFYNGACFSALAAAGTGKEGATLDPAERRRLRAQALEWLKTSLQLETARSAKASTEERKKVVARMQFWFKDSDLASVRDVLPLMELPAGEREQFLALWSDVHGLQARLQEEGSK